jgi:hypothetical protein
MSTNETSRKMYIFGVREKKGESEAIGNMFNKFTFPSAD